MSTFMEAYVAAVTGRIVKSSVTENYYSLQWGFLKDVLTGRSPLIDEFLGTWTVTDAIFTDFAGEEYECSDYTPLQ